DPPPATALQFRDQSIGRNVAEEDVWQRQTALAPILPDKVTGADEAAEDGVDAALVLVADLDPDLFQSRCYALGLDLLPDEVQDALLVAGHRRTCSARSGLPIALAKSRHRRPKPGPSRPLKASKVIVSIEARTGAPGGFTAWMFSASALSIARMWIRAAISASRPTA